MAYRNSLPENNVYVDGVNGNDAAAVKYNSFHPYKTIGAALAVASLGDVIYIRPGTYSTGFVNLFKDGITYNCMPGTFINQAYFNVIAGQSCTVIGEGIFDSSGTKILDSLVLGTFYMEALDIKGIQNTINYSAGKVTLNVRDIDCYNQGTINLVDTLSLDPTNNLSINCRDIKSNTFAAGPNPTINNVTGGPGLDATVKVVARYIYGTPNSDAEIMNFDNYIVPNNRTTIEIIADRVIPLNLTGTNALVTMFFCDNTKYIINTKMDTRGSSRSCVYILAPMVGTDVSIIGEYLSGGDTAIKSTGTGGIVRLDGNFTVDAGIEP